MLTIDQIKSLQFTGIHNAKKVTGLSYLGSVNSSSKIVKNTTENIDTYILYLAPANLSGFNTCAKATAECKAACLNGSGRAKIDRSGKIENARIFKTQIFFYNRPFFMQWLIAEIKAAEIKATKAGHGFSVRLNGTSDLNPVTFNYDGKNILQIFPDIQFYDYTKIANRFRLLDTYPNYDLTFSFSGYNWTECEELLKAGTGRVAMVFYPTLPDTFNGYPVINGDKTDLRYKDDTGVIVGLKFKAVKNKIDVTQNKFITVVPAKVTA